jgi:pyridoxal phosphate enzyme (YggS family)
MAPDPEVYNKMLKELGANVQLVAVSKTKTVADILALYAAGQRDFGENYVQELVDKQGQLPADIRWHFIGHLQSNKVRYILPFVYLIHGVDSIKLLKEIDRVAAKTGRVVDVLLQVHIAREETKFGTRRRRGRGGDAGGAGDDRREGPRAHGYGFQYGRPGGRSGRVQGVKEPA